ncbi:DUF6063 family protein [Clostridium tertium]|uniref:DUF6063 family protein n=1 Tax=Clostridium tertium TaxID=1559 RepID=UPI0024B35FB8|nr:DUF6063 family protein [Clostridium tertium]MDI9215612.1 DUF6063 family protein [Clostridium tertium]
MSYEINNIKIANKIFYELLKKGEIKEDENEELYRAYSENEDIMNLVKTQGEECECDIEKYMGVIYLIPKEENDFLGYSKKDLKSELCKSGATDKDYYLSQFVILTLLVQFYNSNGYSSLSKNFIKIGEFINILEAKLKEGASRSKEEEDNGGIAFSNILEKYQALKVTEKQSTAKTTKEGFIRGILDFLDKQGLIYYIKDDDMIKTTKKLDNFMDWNLLNRNNYYRVLKALVEEVNE